MGDDTRVDSKKRLNRFLIVGLFGLILSGCNLKDKKNEDAILFDGKLYSKESIKPVNEDYSVRFINEDMPYHVFTIHKTKSLTGQYKVERATDILHMQPNPARFLNMAFQENDLLESLILPAGNHYKKGQKIKSNENHEIYFRRVSNCGEEEKYFDKHLRNNNPLPNLYILELQVILPNTKDQGTRKATEERERMRKGFEKIELCKLLDK